MTDRRLCAAGSLLAALVLTVLAGCSGDPGGTGSSDDSAASSGSQTPSETVPSSTVVPAPRAPRPEDGLCYAFSYADAVASTTEVAPTSCRREHTARTFHVGTLDNVVDGHLLAVDSERVRAQVAAECPDRLGRYLGGTQEALRLSMFRTVWFSPTIEQSDDGQNWYRCDVIALAADEELAPLGRRLKGVLDRDGSEDRYGMCGTEDPERKSFARVICSEDHSWRAIATIDAPGKAKDRDPDYPGARALRSDGKSACEDPARAVAPDPLSVTWSYEPPTRAQWNAGQHYGICWVPAN